MPKGKRGTGAPYLRAKTYWIKYYVDGQPVYESTGTSNKSEAVKILNRKRLDADRGQASAEKCRVEDLLLLLVKEQVRLQRADVAHVRSRVDNHLRPALGRILVNRLTNRNVEIYIDSRLGAGAASSTINRELACLKTALRIGFDHNLVHRLIRWKKLPETNVRSGFLDHDDYRKLLSALPDELRLLLVFGYHYGIRKSELLRYRWDYVDWFSKELRVPQPDSKNHEPKILPFYGDVESWLCMEKTRRDKEYPKSTWIFSRQGRPIKDFRGSWANAVQQVDLQDSLGWFHDLRRSAVRNMTNAGMDQKIAMAISGHKTESIFRRYRIVARRDLRRAAERMNKFFDDEDRIISGEVTEVVTPIDRAASRRLRKNQVN